MDQKADHPHHAAVHLMKAIRCCKDCYNVSELDYAELGQLQFEKDILTRQLNQIENPQLDLQRVSAQVRDLQFLINKVREQNEIAYQSGMRQVQQVIIERQTFQKQKNQAYYLQVQAQKDRHNALSLQIQKQIEHIRYLHRINEQLVHNFCKY